MGRCGTVRGAVSGCYRAAMLMLMLFVDSRYCVTDLQLVGGDLGILRGDGGWFDERGEEAEDGKEVRRLFCTGIAADSRARKPSNAPASVPVRRNSQVRFEPRAGYGVAWKMCEIR
jgi:hypothetical protein